MCRATTCKKCGKPSWAGCGAHVEQVLGDVPKAERCRCREDAVHARATKANAGPAESTSSTGRFLAWLRR